MPAFIRVEDIMGISLLSVKKQDDCVENAGFRDGEQSLTRRARTCVVHTKEKQMKRRARTIKKKDRYWKRREVLGEKEKEKGETSLETY